MGKGIRHVDTTSKRFVDAETGQFLVDYPFLVGIPGGLQLNISFVISKGQITHLSWKKDVHAGR